MISILWMQTYYHGDPVNVLGLWDQFGVFNSGNVGGMILQHNVLCILMQHDALYYPLYFMSK